MSLSEKSLNTKDTKGTKGSPSVINDGVLRVLCV
jgi:hypothetical protein